jgi:hypothetical protein
MGWNDRLPEDPYTPYESHDEQDAYDNWLNYVESLRAEEAASGLTSVTATAEELTDIAAKLMAAKMQQTQPSSLDRVREFFNTLVARKTTIAPDEVDPAHENANSR